jgi:uncharacterized phage protein gp47/JayE
MALREFYSFQQIVQKAITYIGDNSNLTDFTPGSNILTISEAWASFVEYLQLQINLAFRSFFPSTSKGQDLDNRMVDFGLVRNLAQPARGILTFGRNTPATSTFTIQQGVIVGTQPDPFGSTVDFATDSAIIFPSGATQVTGYVTCQLAGVIGNVGSGRITNILSTIGGVDFVVNPEAFVNGSSLESDDMFRKRIPIFLNGLKKGNEDAILSAILAIPGMTYADLEENVPTPGNVTVFVSNESGVLTDEQKSQVLLAAQKAAAFAITTSLVTPDIEYVNVSLDVEIDNINTITGVVVDNVKIVISNFINSVSSREVKMFDLIGEVGQLIGVLNVKNVKINGVNEDYTVPGFSVVKIEDYVNDITVNVV